MMPKDYIFGIDKKEKYAMELSYLNILQGENLLSETEYSRIKTYLKSKYGIA